MLSRILVFILLMSVVSGCSDASKSYDVPDFISEDSLRLESNHLQGIKEETLKKYEEANRKTAHYIKRVEYEYELSKKIEEEIKRINAHFDKKTLEVEGEYQMQIFNIELKLETLRNKPSVKLQLQTELERAKGERDKRIETLNMERAKMIAEQKALLSD